MRNIEELNQIKSTLSFLRSVILSGEPMTEQVRASINESLSNVKSLESRLESRIENSAKSEEVKKILTELSNAFGYTLSGQDMIREHLNKRIEYYKSTLKPNTEHPNIIENNNHLGKEDEP